MDTSTSAITASEYIRGMKQLRQEDIAQADWEAVIKDLLDDLLPRLKYMPHHSAESLFEFTYLGARYGSGTSMEYGHGVTVDTRLIKFCDMPRHSRCSPPVEVKIDLLAMDMNGRLLRMFAEYIPAGSDLLFQPKQIEVEPTTLAQLDLTGDSPLRPFVKLGAYLVWRINALSSEIVEDRDKHTEPFRRVSDRSMAFMMRIAHMKELLRESR